MTDDVPADTPGAFIIDQYLADFSIENPGGRVSPERAAELELGLEVAVHAEALPGAPPGLYGVQIALGMPARLSEGIIFLIELRYRVNVQVQGVDVTDLAALLHVQIPNAVFPALKAIVEANGAFAGYPEISMLPIDFAGLFRARTQGQEP